MARRGPISATATACATIANAIGDSVRMILHGDADAMIAGGAEAAVTPLSVGGFAAMRALSTRNDEPTHASRPFDKDRDGFVIGEGAGILILEELEFAKARGAKILAEVIGYGMSADAYHMTGIAPEGAGRAAQHEGRPQGRRHPAGRGGLHQRPRHRDPGRRRQRIAGHRGGLRRARPQPQAQGQRHQVHDRPPAGRRGRPGSRHHRAGAGQPELPPTINLENVDPECRLDYVPNKAIAHSFDIGLSNSFGFGGINATLIMRRWQ